MALPYKKTLADSRAFVGVPGLLSFAVVRALRAAGASKKKVKAALDIMVAEFPKMSACDAEGLRRVLLARLKD